MDPCLVCFWYIVIVGIGAGSRLGAHTKGQYAGPWSTALMP